MTAVLPGIPENWSTPVAPTKPPFLWNAPQGLWTQWRGVQQVPIERNLIETMGVFMSINLHAKTSEGGAVRIERGDRQSAGGREPACPAGAAQVAGGGLRQDRPREGANAGRDLFITHCSGCHNAWPYTWTEPNKYGKRFVLVGLIPQSTVGTDPNQFETVRPYANHGSAESLSAWAVQGQGPRCRPAISITASRKRFWKPRFRKSR